MLAVRNFLMSILGGSDLMWDVALGVIIAGIVLGVLWIVIGVWSLNQ